MGRVHGSFEPLIRPSTDAIEDAETKVLGPCMTNTPSERPEGAIDPKLLEILVCPLTKQPLDYDSVKQELISRAAKLAYPIRDGIPIMLAEEARRID
jgi:uncharacterized protein YbaR (Trm112 family)